METSDYDRIFEKVATFKSYYVVWKLGFSPSQSTK